MSYRLDLVDAPADAVRASAREQLENGAAVLRDEHDKDPVGAVHQARKNVKKSRAILRLVRPDLGNKTYRRENRALRDAARSVAHVRDADVMVETVEKLHERFAGRLPKAAFDRLSRALRKDASGSRSQANGELGADLIDALRAAATRVDDWPLDGAGWSTVRKGIAVAYKRGGRAFAVADSDPTTENLHEWRKRVKDLWYHQRLIKPAWPEVLGAQADAAHELSDLLGDEHDLAVLAERLEDDPPTADSDAILELIEERRAELLSQIRALGRRVYAEKPKAFTRRIGRYLRAARAGEPVPG
jgi:CHAD domain-containing protein